MSPRFSGSEFPPSKMVKPFLRTSKNFTFSLEVLAHTLSRWCRDAPLKTSVFKYGLPSLGEAGWGRSSAQELSPQLVKWW